MAKRKVGKPYTYLTRTSIWLKAPTPRQRIILILTVLVVFLLLGSVLGTFWAWRQSPSLSGDSSIPPTPTTQPATETGVVRQFRDSQHGGIDFYLEKGDGTKVLLKSSGIDLDFFEGTAVTVEGTMTTIGDDSTEVLQVKKVWIKSS